MEETIVLKTTFKFRRGTAQEWTSINPILAAGEPGFELDAHGLKIGDGVSAWNDLKYSSASALLSPDESSLIVNQDGKLEIYGFKDALGKQVPYKTETGQIGWMALSAVIQQGDIKDLQQTETIELYGGSATEVTE